MRHYLKGLLSVASVTLLSIPTCALAAPPGTGWKLKFSDDFNGTSLDTSKWNSCYQGSNNGCTRNSGQDLQSYQKDDVLVKNGMLRLRAQKRRLNGYNYTSGMISSHGKFSFRYGYAEIRARMPKGRGFWTNLSLSPQKDTWPPELDIAEYLGFDPFRLHAIFHYENSSGNSEQSATDFAVPDLSQDFHTFAVKWDPQGIVWYVDDVEPKRYEIQEDIPAEPMYLKAAFALTPAWTNTPPDETTPFPSYLEIDYIKVWQDE